jgi:hypothetical protein
MLGRDLPTTGREYTYSICICKLEARKIFLSHFKWPSSQDQQKTIVRRLITSKVTLTGQSHFMLIFVLRKATLPNRINSVPWMNAVTPTPYHECTQLVWIKVALRSRQTACIHGTELVWPRSFMVRSWCDRGHSWYGVDVTASIHGTELVWFRKVIPRGSCVHCTVAIHLADFFLFVFHQWRKNPPNFIHKNTTIHFTELM